ncbi:MAG: hypothetical protein C0501_19025 [Isosphaera sp.]|nr:hypothetical protein [Isosphaera sp.]
MMLGPVQCGLACVAVLWFVTAAAAQPKRPAAVPKAVPMAGNDLAVAYLPAERLSGTAPMRSSR